MKIMQKMYDKCVSWANHKNAVYFLSANSFAESIFWPIPVDVMIIPMCLANRDKSYYYAMIATITSVLGAVVGYYLGFFLYELYLVDLFETLGWAETMEKVQEYLQRFGIFFIIIGSLTPVPYKVVAICCGYAAANHTLNIPTWQLNIWSFIIVSLIGRGARFYLEAFLIKIGGEKMANKIRSYIDIIGWTVVAVSLVIIVCYMAL